MNDPRGSIWRKWDLHIHTPASFHWQGGLRFADMKQSQKDSTLAQIVKSVNDSPVGVFAVMDYWTFDGYLEIQNYVERTGEKLNKPILPGMELRIEAPVDFRLNIHVMLSDKLSKQQLQDFKSKLRIGLISKTLSDESLVACAKKLDASVAQKHGFTAGDLKDDRKLWELGCKTAKVTRESLEKAVREMPDKTCLIVMPYDTSDGLMKLDWAKHPYDDSYFMQSAHIFETRSPDNIDLFLGRRTKSNEKIFDNFMKTLGGKPKPAVSGSDAHKISDYGAFPGDRITWIKADPTFEGLLQLVNEPEGRSFIGEIPPKLLRVQAHTTKYISSIRIEKTATSSLAEVWFENEIDLNPDLVAIIGNKGNGKSALADTIGLLGDTRQADDAFSFLSLFRDPKQNKAKNFEATLTWESGSVGRKLLSDPLKHTRPELVKYIPQNFLESICNEISSTTETDFDRELRKVIFSHVTDADRLAKPSLEELISYRTEEANARIAILRQELHAINEETIALEDRLLPEHRATIEGNLALKKRELAAHDDSKPVTVKKPENDPTKQREISKIAADVKDAKRKQREFEKVLAAAKDSELTQTLQISRIDKVLGKLDNFQRLLDSFIADCASDLQEIGLKPDDIVKVQIDRNVLRSKRKTFSDLLTEARREQDIRNAEGPAFGKRQIEKLIADLQVQLDAPNKRYQAYLVALEGWKKTREDLVGRKNSIGSIKFYENQLVELDNVPAVLLAAEQGRLNKAKEIHGEISRLASIYRELYSPVNDFIENKPLARDKFHLNFEVNIIDRGFTEQFFSFISQGVAGTFCGLEEGVTALEEILKRHDFNSESGVVGFLNEVLECLRTDKRPGGGPVRIARLLRKGQSVLSFYDELFGLNYLDPRYALRMGDKELNQLSPGERGTLLLVFYLLVDKDDIPLIIDQPEENLDNQTVYELLVPCIKEAKERRQVFIVTHNPNLAVVCDAEQIICASLDKKNRQRVQYLTGAIENPEINKKIVDILEGTRPAFDNRESKYLDGE
ncbi:MAG TPA: hypothetical protein VKC61_24990 [Pyrinomonadaceae bacterium]|nr:hypothetical protein [Pyrinomonadaceae bacterium]